MKKIQVTEVENSIFESQLIDIQNEKRRYDNISDDVLIINQRIASKDYMAFIFVWKSLKSYGPLNDGYWKESSRLRLHHRMLMHF